jgi:hypothetical protein
MSGAPTRHGCPGDLGSSSGEPGSLVGTVPATPRYRQSLVFRTGVCHDYPGPFPAPHLPHRIRDGAVTGWHASRGHFRPAAAPPTAGSSWPWLRAALLLAIAPAPLSALTAFATAPIARLAAPLTVVVLVAGIAGQVTHTGLFFVPALAAMAVAALILWRERA